MNNNVIIVFVVILVILGLYFFVSGKITNRLSESVKQHNIVTKPPVTDKYLVGIEVAVPEEPGVSFTITSDGFVNKSDFTHTGTYPITPDALDEGMATFVAHVDRTSAQEGPRHIYMFTAFNFGGTGNFGYLTAVNRETKKSVFSLSLGDRVKFLGVKVSPIAGSESEEIQVMYVTRADGKVGDEAYLGDPTTERFEVLPDGQIRGLQGTVLDEVRVSR